MKAKFRLLLITLISLSAFISQAKELVTTGVYINDIQNIDLKTHSYSADIYLWFRWKNPKWDPAESFEFMNAYELWGHVRKKEFDKNKEVGGEFYQVVRNQGRFSTKFDLSEYPFDKQVLSIEIEDSHSTKDFLEYILDNSQVILNPKLRLPGFKLGTPIIKVMESEYPTPFGDPTLFTKKGLSFSRVKVEVPIYRPLLPYGFKIFLPILCVIFCTIIMFFFHPKYVDARVGIGITALLTIVALQITLNDELPAVDYLLLVDKVYIASYLFVIVALASAVRSTILFDKSLEEIAIKKEKKVILYSTLVFILSVLLIVICG